MKTILQEIFIYSFALYATSLLFPGLKINGGIVAIATGGLLLAIGFVIVKPVVQILALPIQFLSFGLFSIVTSALVLFLVTLVYHGIRVVSFTFPRTTLGSFEIKSFHAAGILSYCIISVTIYLISKLLSWLFDV